jgi:hypothetical protein
MSMVRPLKGLGLGAVFLALSLLPGAARAADEDTGDSSSASSAVPVHLRSLAGGEHVEIETFVGRKKPGDVVLQCTEDCDGMLTPGPYRVRLYDASGHEAGSTRVSLEWATTFRASAPESRSLGKWGLGMGIVGSAATGIGRALLLLSGLSVSDDPLPETPSERQAHRQLQIALGITTLAGAALAVTGWALFASNSSALQTSTDYPWRRVSFGVAPTDHGLVTGVTALF